MTVLAGEEFGTNMKNGNFATSETGARSVDRIVVERMVERGVHGQRRSAVEHRIAVGIGVGDISIADIGAAAGFVLDDDLLAPSLR